MPAGDAFDKFMLATAGGTQGSSTYGMPKQDRPPVFGSTPATGGGGSSGDYNPNLNVNPNVGGQGTGGQGTGGQDGGGQGTGGKDEDTGSGIQNETIQKFLFGTIGDKKTNIKDFEKSGKHPLRAQLDYLVAKYGDSVLDTEQGKVLMGYLAGVPVERGGGLGARDDNYGLTGDEATEYQSKLLLDEDLMDASNYRQKVLNQFSGIGSLERAEGTFQTSDFLKNLDIEKLKLGLTPEQYFNFRQQLMAADPTPENKLYKSTFPFASGDLTSGLGQFIPGVGAAKTFLGGFLPERNLTGYQQNIDPLAATFTSLPVEREGVTSLPFALARNITPPSDGAGDDQDDSAPTLPPIVSQTPFTPFDIRQFYTSLPQYTQQGIMNPNLMSYYQNLGLFPGMAV